MYRRFHLAGASISFLVALVTYGLTMQPSISFWDCGEFAAAAIALQVPHPPGAPLWTLVGRIAMLVPLGADPVARYNALSVLASALTVLLLYLTTVKFIKIYSGEPDSKYSAICLYLSGLVGALCFAWTDSFWFNAVECEVYAFGSLFIALILWLTLVWHERAEVKGSERILLLIAYLIGLSLGVHQLALLTIFPVFLLVYYRRHSHVGFWSWARMVVVAIGTFLFIYIIVLTKLVAWAGAGDVLISLGVLSFLAIAVLFAYTRRKTTAIILLNGVLFVLLGYTTYTTVLIRASQHPPMNEGNPSNFARLGHYIDRDQYGEWKLLPRRLPEQRLSHEQTWTDYSSSLAFFVEYQTNFMFHRYLGWNFIGRATDHIGSGVDPWKTLGLPLLFGIVGLLWQFKRDRRRALVLLVSFVLFGYLTAWFQNQQEPQPRERDYFYVAAFYIYAVWIGLGTAGILSLVARRSFRDAMLVFVLLAVPLNQLLGLTGLAFGEPLSESSRWAEYSRRQNFVPWEYAYNILQSCEPNAILFTYGDNDTFPLWALQAAYGVRRDIRIVQLQLANLMWYCQALPHPTDWGTRGISLSAYTNSVMRLPEPEAYKIISRHSTPIDLSLATQTTRWIIGDTTIGPVVMHAEPTVQLPSDYLVADIIKNNLATRPIYYSATVPDNARAGLNAYLMYEGLVARVVPIEQPLDPSGLGVSIQATRYSKMLFGRPLSEVRIPHRGFILRSYRNVHCNLSALDKEYAATYRLAFIRYADAMLAEDIANEAARSLDSMSSAIPLSRVPIDYTTAAIVTDIAEKSGDWGLARSYAASGAKSLAIMLSQQQQSDSTGQTVEREYEYADLLMKSGQYRDAETKFSALRAATNAAERGLLALKLEECAARQALEAGANSQASVLFRDLLQKYDPDVKARGEFRELWNLLQRSEAMHGATPEK